MHSYDTRRKRKLVEELPSYKRYHYVPFRLVAFGETISTYTENFEQLSEWKLPTSTIVLGKLLPDNRLFALLENQQFCIFDFENNKIEHIPKSNTGVGLRRFRQQSIMIRLDDYIVIIQDYANHFYLYKMQSKQVQTIQWRDVCQTISFISCAKGFSKNRMICLAFDEQRRSRFILFDLTTFTIQHINQSNRFFIFRLIDVFDHQFLVFFAILKNYKRSIHIWSDEGSFELTRGRQLGSCKSHTQLVLMRNHYFELWDIRTRTCLKSFKPQIFRGLKSFQSLNRIFRPFPPLECFEMSEYVFILNKRYPCTSSVFKLDFETETFCSMDTKMKESYLYFQWLPNRKFMTIDTSFRKIIEFDPNRFEQKLHKTNGYVIDIDWYRTKYQTHLFAKELHTMFLDVFVYMLPELCFIVAEYL